MQTLIKNGTLVLPDRLIEDGWLLIEDERIVALGENATCPQGIAGEIDAAGDFVLPGLIDLHCDAIEKLVEPRPNVQFDLHVAIGEVDHRLAACGITTEFHALSLDDSEFGVRSTDFVRRFAQAVQAEPDLVVRHEVHARFELTSENGFEVIKQLIAEREVRLVSLMDHSPGQGQYASEEAFRDYVKRTVNKTDAELDQLLEMKRRQAINIPQRIATVTQLAREAKLALATHDDDTAAKVEQWPALGVTMAEFPTTLEAARRAHELGLAVCMGAPNVLRGKSSGGNLSALAAIEAGVTDVLCADYYPAAMLGAAFKLAALHILDLPQAVRLVTLNPAQAVGLADRFGSLEPGKIADLLIVRLNHLAHPKVRQVLVNGRTRLSLN